MPSTTKKKTRLRPEIFVILAIIFCVLYMVNYNTQYRMHGTISIEKGVMTILRDKKDIDAFNELKHEIIEYQPDACKMIRMYDEDLDTIFTIFFSDGDIEDYDITNFPSLEALYEGQEEGHQTVTINDTKVDITFRWTVSNGESYLLMYASSQSALRHLNEFNFVCYLMVILVFLLFFIMVFWQHKSIQNQYKMVARDAQTIRMLR